MTSETLTVLMCIVGLLLMYVLQSGFSLSLGEIELYVDGVLQIPPSEPEE